MNADSQQLGAVLRRHPAEVTQFHNPGLFRILLFQIEQSVVDRHHDGRAFAGKTELFVEIDAKTCAPFGRAAGAGAIHQDLAHQPGSDSEEVGAAVEARIRIAAQPQPGFMNKGGWLQSQTRALALKVDRRHFLQLGVDQRDKPVAGVLIALVPGSQQSRDWGIAGHIPILSPGTEVIHGPGTSGSRHRLERNGPKNVSCSPIFDGNRACKDRDAPLKANFMAINQRRQRIRYRLQLPLQVVRIGFSRVQETVLTQDISSGGVCFHCAAAMAVGVRVEYFVTLSGSCPPVRIHCLGRVLRADPSPEPGLAFEIAVSMERYRFASPVEVQVVPPPVREKRLAAAR